MGPADHSAEDPHRTGRRRALVALAVLLAVVAWIVWQPGPPARGEQSALQRYLADPARSGLPAWITFALVEWCANVVMFVPLSFLGALSLRRRPWLVLPLAVAVSTGIELVQLLLLPAREASLLDVLANSIGALLGFLAALPLLRRRRRGSESSDRPQRENSPNGSSVRPTSSATESITRDGRNG